MFFVSFQLLQGTIVHFVHERQKFLMNMTSQAEGPEKKKASGQRDHVSLGFIRGSLLDDNVIVVSFSEKMLDLITQRSDNVFHVVSNKSPTHFTLLSSRQSLVCFFSFCVPFSFDSLLHSHRGLELGWCLDFSLLWCHFLHSIRDSRAVEWIRIFLSKQLNFLCTFAGRRGWRITGWMGRKKDWL